MPKINTLWLLTWLLCSVLSVESVHAQDDAWQRHLDAGEAAYKQGNYTKAVRQTEAAYDEDPFRRRPREPTAR